MAGVSGLERLRDRWELPVAGQHVTQLCIDYAITLRLGNDVSIRIEQPFILETGDGSRKLVVPGGDVARLAPVLSLARARVAQGLAFDDGHLEVRFDDGFRVSVPSTQDYEPWELVGPADLRIVSLPGGELSVWLPAT